MTTKPLSVIIPGALSGYRIDGAYVDRDTERPALGRDGNGRFVVRYYGSDYAVEPHPTSRGEYIAVERYINPLYWRTNF